MARFPGIVLYDKSPTVDLKDPEFIKVAVYKTIAIIDNEKTGLQIRKNRERFKIKLREVARRTGYSPAYICDLEKGRRKWTLEKIDKIMMAIVKDKI